MTIKERRYDAVRLLVEACHDAARTVGWWDHAEARHVPTLLCLIHSEVSEALEGYRKGLRDDHLPHRQMLEVELADVLIRVFDMAGGLHLDLAGALVEKMAYNATREDHRRDVRAAAGGKTF